MIITANGTPHTVDIEKRFRPVYIRALKFITSMSGKTQVSDRGANADKYECTFTVIGDIADIDALVADLENETEQITIDTEGLKIFGSGIDHSGTFICNVGGVVTDQIRDLVTSTVTLRVRVVSPIVYDSSIPVTLPTLYYQWPVGREVNRQSNEFDTISIGDYGKSIKVSGASTPIKGQVTTFQLKQKADEFGQLHRFVADTRGSSFTINTSNLEIFRGSTSETVKITRFDYTPDDFNFWDVTITMVANV
jgi:hypothetical protein